MEGERSAKGNPWFDSRPVKPAICAPVLHGQVRVLARLQQILTPSASETPLVIRCSYTWDGRSCAPGTGYAQLYDRTSGSLSLSLFCSSSASVSLVSCGHILVWPRSLVSKGHAAFTELRSILSELILFVVARVPNPMNSF